ncbi:MAG: 3-dehydroquinate synthase family protein [Actinomycetota bacterium]
MRIEHVSLGERSYPVVVGRGARAEIDALLPREARRVAVVTEDGVPRTLLPDLGDRAVSIHVIEPGESGKMLSTIESLCRGFSSAGLTRADAVVGVGGGLVTDVAGFAASVYHRGIAVAHVATTLLAMVDAAIGGKTGVNLPEGKNLVGAYWQPSVVACDIDALDSLPARETRCGHGEMAKYHFIVREDLSSLDLEERIARCVRIKADIVASDEREGGVRALLNYGHTLGHALESESGWALAHGEAVALGLLFAAHLGHRTGRIGAERVEDHYGVVHGLYDLRPPLPSGLRIEALIASMARDKKALGSLTFVLDSDRGLEVVRDVSEVDVRAAWVDFTARNA